MLVNQSAEYPKHDEDEASNEVLLHVPRVLKAPFLVHFLLKKQCDFVHCQAKFII
jgi:hypothetical protein